MADVNEIKAEVRKKIKRDLENMLENYVDNLAHVVKSEIPEYDLDWCAEDPADGGADKYSQNTYELIENIVDNELAILFIHA